MKRVFHDYGGMIIVVIAVVSLIGLTVFLMKPGSVMANAFSAITGQFVDAADDMIGGAGAGGDSEDVAATPYNQVYVAEVGGSLWEARLIEVDGALTAYLIVDDALDGELPVAIEGQNMMANGEVVGTFTEDFKSVTLSEDFGGITLSGELATIAMGKVYGTSIYADGGYITIQYVFYEDGSASFSYSFGDEADAGTAPAGSCKYDNGVLWFFDDERGAYVFDGIFALSDERLYFSGIVLEPGGGAEPDTSVIPGLYETGSNYTVLKTSWSDLLADGTITVENGVVYTNCDIFEQTNSSSDALCGDLMLPADGSITALGNLTNTFSGNVAFAYCTGLTGIAIPDSVTSIGAHAFGYCTSLTNVTFGDNSQLTSIGDTVFQDCSSLESIEIPASVTSIATWAFYECTSLTSVTFGDNSQLTSIGEEAFYRCSSLASIEIPDGVTSIGESVFGYCESLTTATFGENSQLTSIELQAFSGCTSLASIVIPGRVTSIGKMSFFGCTNLESIRIPDRVTSIGDNAFDTCTSLTTVNYTGTEEQWAAISIGAANTPLTGATINYNYEG